MLREYRLTFSRIAFKDKHNHNKLIQSLRSPLDPYRRFDEEKEKRKKIIEARISGKSV